MRKKWLIIYHLVRNSDPELTGELSEVNAATARTLCKMFVCTVDQAMADLNNRARVDGDNRECEADEIALRCIVELRGTEKGFV